MDVCGREVDKKKLEELIERCDSYAGEYFDGGHDRSQVYDIMHSAVECFCSDQQPEDEE